MGARRHCDGETAKVYEEPKFERVAEAKLLELGIVLAFSAKEFDLFDFSASFYGSVHPIFKCTLLDLAIFWLPMHLLQVLSLWISRRGKISAQWSGIYETSVMPLLLVSIFKESLGITLSTFKVTKKTSQGQIVDKRTIAPFAILLALTLAGIAHMTYMMLVHEYVGILAVLFWLVRNAYYLAMSLFLSIGRDSDGENVKVIDAENVLLLKTNGQKAESVTTKLTEHSVDIFVDEQNVLLLGVTFEFEIISDTYRLNLKGTVIRSRIQQFPFSKRLYLGNLGLWRKERRIRADAL